MTQKFLPYVNTCRPNCPQLSSIFICVLFEALAALTVRPSDTVSVVGKDTYFNCTSTLGDKPIDWYHYQIGSSQRKPVYGHNKFYPPYLGRFQTNNLTGAYDLRITGVTEGDAGIYECQDDAGYGDKGQAQLIVLCKHKCQLDSNILTVNCLSSQFPFHYFYFMLFSNIIPILCFPTLVLFSTSSFSLCILFSMSYLLF